MKKVYPLVFLTLFSFLFFSCGKKGQENVQRSQSGDVATSPNTDADIQMYNLRVKQQQAGTQSAYDTLSVVEYVLKNYPKGSYLVNFDKTFTYNIPKPAVIYLNSQNGTYVFAVVAKSKPGERLIESKNVVGYDQSFVNLDSTHLGTAFFYLVLLKAENGSFTNIWESPIPAHGGFNYMDMQKWAYNGTPYVRVDFHYARGIGHIDYNYFLVNGLINPPHLLMTYEWIDAKRTIANVNDDKYPDYYEYLYYNLPNRIYAADSIPFVWDVKDSLYVNTRNHRQTQPY
ncbi:MAG: hypothetical protein ACYDEE_00635 [Ignavibacteriaceae bacterium]